MEDVKADLSEFEYSCEDCSEGEPDAADGVLGVFFSDGGGEDGCNGDSFGEGKVGFDDECSSEGDHPEDTEDAADERDRGGLEVVDLSPDVEEDEGGDSEDDTCGDAFSC